MNGTNCGLHYFLYVIARSATTKQSQNGIATPFGLAMMTFGGPDVKYFITPVITVFNEQ
jgi:hypothetical protein